MNRDFRVAIAKQTVAIAKAGQYTSRTGRLVDIASAVRACVAGTRLFVPAEVDTLRAARPEDHPHRRDAVLSVVNQSTLQGIADLLTAAPQAPVAALNFASARNPGGGFLDGSQAQEESLARSSALHASLTHAPQFYETHRRNRSLLYSDAVIVSPACPVFRNDEGDLLESPQSVTFLTCAAPNAGALADHGAEDEVVAIPATFRRRVDGLLAVAVACGCTRLVLGAWGCGVFRNDPVLVATAFAEALRSGCWARQFAELRFSVLDRSPTAATIQAFHRLLADARA